MSPQPRFLFNTFSPVSTRSGPDCWTGAAAGDGWKGLPHFGQAAAFFETIAPQSGHSIRLGFASGFGTAAAASGGDTVNVAPH